MLRTFRAVATSLVLVSGCAAQQRSLAYQGAQVARDLANDGAIEWKAAVERQVDKCREEVPKENSTKSEREKCMGIFNETDKAQRAFEALVAAQHAVYWALKFGEMKDVKQALSQLDSVMADARPFLEALRK